MVNLRHFEFTCRKANGARPRASRRTAGLTQPRAQLSMRRGKRTDESCLTRLTFRDDEWAPRKKAARSLEPVLISDDRRAQAKEPKCPADRSRRSSCLASASSGPQTGLP